MIECHELLRERVRVRRHVPAVDHKRAIAIAAIEVAQDLVERPILLHDEHDMIY